MTTRDYTALERKLALGTSLSVAAEEAGMTEEEAREHLAKRKREGDEADDMAFLFLTNACSRLGFETLEAITQETEVLVSESFGEGRGHRRADWHVTAAQTLLKAGFEGRKLLERKAAAKEAAKQLDRGLDLFDRSKSAWKFKGDS